MRESSGVAKLKVLEVGGRKVVHTPHGRGKELQAYLAAHGVRCLVSTAAQADYDRLELGDDEDTATVQSLVDGWAR